MGKKIIMLFQLIVYGCLYYPVALPAANRIVVDCKGQGDYVTIADAIRELPPFNTDEETTIFVRKGIYREKIEIPSFICNLRLVGEDADETIISFNDHAKTDDMGTFRCYTLLVRGNDIVLENLTIENNAPPVAQAVALHLEGDRIVIRKCTILGNQDTIYTGKEASRNYFEACYIEGTTDYIFGPSTCWFEQCRLHCKANSYITAASTPPTLTYGYIFNNCTLTLAPGVTAVYLGRPWRRYAMTLFMNCEFPEGIWPEGWDNWEQARNELTARYMEYNNYGPGAVTARRVGWASRLTGEEAGLYTLAAVMAGYDNWNPLLVITE